MFEGDIVEVADPRRPEGVERCFAAKVKVNNFGSADMQHTSVTWGRPAPPRVAPVRRLTFENLHPAVQSAAGELFADGRYETSVSEAFKSIEVRVRGLTGLDRSGAALMGDAFRTDGSVLDVAGHEGRSGEDEREGFMHVFRGAMIGIRNPGAHELFKLGYPQQALSTSTSRVCCTAASTLLRPNAPEPFGAVGSVLPRCRANTTGSESHSSAAGGVPCRRARSLIFLHARTCA